MNSVSTAFEHTRVPYGDDGKLVRGIIARCGAPYCEAAVPLPVNLMESKGGRGADDHIEWQFISRKLEQKGWRIGKSRTSHRCPKCFNAARLAAVRKSEEKPMVSKNETPLHVVQENPRVMQRDDRRLIFDKLNEVYVDNKVGYSKGWTDEKVALDLGVPRAWLKTVREEFFGDEVSNEDIREQIKDAAAMFAQMRTIEPEMRRLLGMADKIEKSLAEIQKVLK
jgi:hypothetical protein